MIELPGNTFALALNLERDSVGAVVLGDVEHLREGDTVKDHRPHPVGADRPGLLGRVVNALGSRSTARARSTPTQGAAWNASRRASSRASRCHDQPVQTG